MADNLTILEGQRAALRFITKTHGQVRTNLGDALEITPKLAIKRLMEFDNTLDALIYSVFEGFTGKYTYSLNNQRAMEAVLMDADPTAASVIIDPLLLAPFHFYANQKGLDGKTKACLLAFNCRSTGLPVTNPLRDPSKRTVDFEGITTKSVNGHALLYTRARSATSPILRPNQPTLTPSASGGTLASGTYYVQVTAKNATGETVPSDEASAVVVGPTGSIAVSWAAVTGATSYNVYVSNVSTGELFSQNVVPTSATITALPSASAARTPLTNTTGAFAATGDKTFAVSTPFNITLDQAAIWHPQTALPYLLVLKNGESVTTGFAFSADGTTFTLDAAPGATDVWEVFTLFVP